MKNKTLISVILVFMMLLSFPVAVFADDVADSSPAENTIYISSADEFLVFAENCRLDSYSVGLSVKLQQDIDLSGVTFAGVPIFCGSFDGQEHSISGLELTHNGTVVGLFRYLTATAKVKNLRVSATVNPKGSRGCVGALAGSNAGIIENCAFTGKVSGGERVGGLVGENRVSGVIENCTSQGQVNGIHFVGGIVGNNMGVIRQSANSASVNVTVQQNSVEISDITMDAMTDSEAANTVTDIGGIVGANGGVLRGCSNHGDIGYKKMGYNVGGIAGSQKGYITECRNYGEIFGRKEVGGIAGQMEPVTNIDYSIDTLQILQGQLEDMSIVAERMAENTQEGADEITWGIQSVADNLDYAWEAVEELMEDPEDEDRILAAQNILSGALGSLEDDLYDLANSTSELANTVSNDVTDIAKQIRVMEETLGNASDNLGASITDISDQDTEEDTTGKISDSANYGAILGDQNVGGITGAMALENDLDPENDVTFSGTESLNFDSEFRAVVRDCKNSGEITAAKQNAGGIAGWVYLGLVKDCVNTGSISAEQADYAGGIAGRSSGFIRQCYAKCDVSAKHYAGGICGDAEEVTDCCSMATVKGTEWVGALLGHTSASFDQEEVLVDDNFYMLVGSDIGAIDGISYDGFAQPLESADFLSNSNLPEEFRSFLVYFQYENGGGKMVRVKVGEKLKKADIPAIPEKEGYVASWEDLGDGTVLTDTVIKAVYTPMLTVIQSDVTEAGQKPVILVEGSFALDAELGIMEDACDWSGKQKLVDSLRFTIPQSETDVAVHYLIPEDIDTQSLQVKLMSQDGNWQDVQFRADGSYLVFTAEPGENQVVLLEKGMPVWGISAIVVVALTLVFGVTYFITKRKKK